jgi:predicted transcriptional regulator
MPRPLVTWTSNKLYRLEDGEGKSMATAKDEVRRILDGLPEDASFEDIQYHIYVREKIERGLEDVKQGRVLSQEEMERRMRRWTGE